MAATPTHVTFIHGLANKPPVDDLRRIWLEALVKQVEGDAGFDLGATGVTASFVYWADLFYDEPLAATDYESRAAELEHEFQQELEGAEAAWIESMQENFGGEFEEDAPVDDLDPELDGYERVPLPRFLKKKILKNFAREAHDYLWNGNGIRDTIRERVMDDFSHVPEDTRHVLFGHSQGTFIAYDVLTGVPECKTIDGFITVGSPLGVDEVQDRLVWTRDNGYPTKLQGEWVNVYDPYDPVARLDPKLASDFRQGGEEKVLDVKEENWGKWRHSASKYYQGPMLRDHFRRLCGRSLP